MVFEVACCCELLVVRECEKCQYTEYAVNLAMQQPGWNVKNFTFAVGALGSLRSVRKQLVSTNLFTRQQETILQVKRPDIVSSLEDQWERLLKTAILTY